MFYLAQNTNLDSVFADIVESITKGVEWGNSVAIALTASLLAITLIRFLYSRN